jgi:hypothetical protein
MGTDVDGSTLWGASVSFEYLLPREKPTKPGEKPAGSVKKEDREQERLLSLFVDYSYNKGSHEENDRIQYAVLGGVRCQSAILKGQKWEPFGHLNVAYVHTKDFPAQGDGAFGLGFGGGVRFNVDHDVAIRVQLDWVRLLISNALEDNYFKAGFGIEYRFGEQNRSSSQGSASARSSRPVRAAKRASLGDTIGPQQP